MRSRHGSSIQQKANLVIDRRGARASGLSQMLQRGRRIGS